jgi:SAM-dependent methyltransferase
VRAASTEKVIWHDIECGAYRADLDLWRELAAHSARGEHAASLLDVGAGTGRVSLPLAAGGCSVTALDRDEDLITELRRRARERGLRVRTAYADARDFTVGRRFDLVLAPMQLVQLLGGERARRSFFRCTMNHLRLGGKVAVAMLDLSGELTDDAYKAPLPDVDERDGWVYSSLPIGIRTLDRGRQIALERVRTAVSPAGEIREAKDTVKLRLLSPAGLEREAATVGLRPVERIAIPATNDHVGSVVVLLEAATA